MLSRNADCPCGSGQRYKHCCGKAPTAPATPRPAHLELMYRALALQKAGADIEAAELYEQALALHPDQPDALNMLGVIRAAQGRLLEAFAHGRRAGELTDWAIPLINRNFSYIARSALANADSARIAEMSRRYRARREAAPVQAPERPRVSLLVLASSGAAALSATLDGLLRLTTPPAEVLVPADLAQGIEERHRALGIRCITLAARSPHQRLNALAETAGGDWLAAVHAEGQASALDLQVVLAARPAPGGWLFALAEDGAGTPQRSALIDESLSDGFALLCALEAGLAANDLLVPLELHRRIGGLRPEHSDPLADYCLRLLWQAEPVLLRYRRAAPAPGGARRAGAPHARIFDDYLDMALTAERSPNEFAPARWNWGLHLASHLVRQGVTPRPDLMRHLNAEIADHLERKSGRRFTPAPGINLYGPARAEFGLGENMRAFARASLEAGIACSIRDCNLSLSTRQGDQSLAGHFAEDALHPCSLYFINPDFRQLYETSLDAAVFLRSDLDFRHYKIGYWFWELQKIPPQWSYALDKVDEVWVATEFVAEAIRQGSTKPVIKVPTPIAVDMRGRYQRRHFDLPEKVFLFLFSFDFNSFPERKNPFGLIRAFLRAFPPQRREVALVIKSINGDKRPQSVAALFEAAGQDPRIVLRDGFLSRDEVFGLQSVADCYVSLHRAEGLGLGLAESMYQGKPVIGTGYSGNLEFMHAGNSALVEHAMVPIRPGDYLYADPGYFWAEPDEEHAAHLMRRMVDDADYRQRLADAGQRDIRSGFSNAATARKMTARLRELGVI